jgi:hypothetical protein
MDYIISMVVEFSQDYREYGMPRSSLYWNLLCNGNLQFREGCSILQMHVMILSEVPNYEQIVSADVVLILQTVLAVMLTSDCGFSLEEQLGKMINILGWTGQNDACGISSFFCFCAEWASGKKLYKVVMTCGGMQISQ